MQVSGEPPSNGFVCENRFDYSFASSLLVPSSCFNTDGARREFAPQTRRAASNSSSQRTVATGFRLKGLVYFTPKGLNYRY